MTALNITGYRWAKMKKTKQLQDELAAPKPNKFNAVKVKLDGHTFDSKAEAKRYCELKLLEKAGEITQLMVHPQFDLLVKGMVVAKYKADFRYWPKDRPISQGPVVEDVKSPPTAKKRDFILIKKLMLALHGIDVEVIGALRSSSRRAA